MNTQETGLVCGSQVQVDRSGQGHCWTDVSADDLPAGVAGWKCMACKVEFTADNLPGDRFARERALVATATNVATVAEFEAHVAERMGLERVMIAD